MAFCPADLEIENWHAGAGSPGERARIGAHLADCSTCRARLDQIQSEEELLAGVRRALAEDPPAPALPGAIPDLARYRTLRRLGEGGMGVVFEAEQLHPRRRVALKILRHGAGSLQARLRFEREAEILGRLDHPGIARVLEAGSFPGQLGPQPFLVMELVDGRPLLDYAAGLGLRDRVELIARICDAVQHAHLQGVMHRDLKPANVLVDRAGRPRVLDFGIARLLDEEAAAAAPHTATGQLLGTLPYMAPEQASGDPKRVDARADVYALGVLLFELLSGRRPREIGDLPLPAAARRLAEVAPLRLRAVAPGLPKDLDAIAACALALERERRYASAAALADDLRRFLRHEPVLARLPRPGYLLRRFARRHRTLVASSAAAVLLLLGGALTAYLQARRARLAEADALAASDFLNDLLELGDPVLGARPADLPLRAALDEAAVTADALAGRPKVEARVRRTLGNAYRGLGLTAAAEPHLTRALELQRRLHGERSAAAAAAWRDLGVLASQGGRYRQAVAHHRRALDIEREMGAESAAALSAVSLAADLLALGDFTAAESLLLPALAFLEQQTGAELSLATAWYWSSRLHQGLGRGGAEVELRRALEVLETSGQGEHLFAAQLRGALAEELAASGRAAEAEPLAQRQLDGVRRLLGRGSAAEGHALLLQVKLHLELGRLVEAERLSEEGLALLRLRLGAHPGVAAALRGLAEVRLVQDDASRAAALLEEALALQAAAWGESHPETARTLLWLAAAHGAAGSHALALARVEEAQQALARSNAPEHPLRWTIELRRGLILADLGRWEAAEALFAAWPETAQESEEPAVPGQVALARASLAYRRGRLPEAEAQVAAILALEGSSVALRKLQALARNLLGQVRHGQRRLEEAAAAFEWAQRDLEELLGAQHPALAAVLTNLGALAETRGELERAAQLHREALALATGTEPRVQELRLGARNNLATVLYRQGRLDQAEAEFRAVLEAKTALLGTADPALATARNNLARALQGLDRYGEAEELLRRAVETWRAAHGDRHPATAAGRGNLASVLHELGRCAEAQESWRAALAAAREVLPGNHPRLGELLRGLGGCLAASGRAAEAAPLLAEAERILAAAPGAAAPRQ